MQEDYVEFVAAPGVFAYLKDQDIEKGIDELLLFQIGRSFLNPAFGACFAEEVISEPIFEPAPNSTIKKNKK